MVERERVLIEEQSTRLQAEMEEKQKETLEKVRAEAKAKEAHAVAQMTRMVTARMTKANVKEKKEKRYAEAEGAACG